MAINGADLNRGLIFANADFKKAAAIFIHKADLISFDLLHIFRDGMPGFDM